MIQLSLEIDRKDAALLRALSSMEQSPTARIYIERLRKNRKSISFAEIQIRALLNDNQILSAQSIYEESFQLFLKKYPSNAAIIATYNNRLATMITERTKNRISRSIWIISLSSLIVTIILFGVGILHTISTGMSCVINRMAELARGQFSNQSENRLAHAKDEFGHLVRAMEEMIDQISELIRTVHQEVGNGTMLAGNLERNADQLMRRLH